MLILMLSTYGPEKLLASLDFPVQVPRNLPRQFLALTLPVPAHLVSVAQNLLCPNTPAKLLTVALPIFLTTAARMVWLGTCRLPRILPSPRSTAVQRLALSKGQMNRHFATVILPVWGSRRRMRPSLSTR